MEQSADFSLRALHAALDAQRQARGISWAQAAREMNDRSRTGHPWLHPLSASTVKGVGTRRVVEGDGVLQMIRWLARTPESFVAGHAESESPRARLPQVPTGHILRFDTKKIYAALDAKRVEHQMSWTQLAEEIGVGASSVTHLAKGGRTAFPQVMRILRWLDGTVAEFTRFSKR